MSELIRRVRMLCKRKQMLAEMEEEMRLHLELREQEHAARGKSAAAARHAAYRDFGNPTLLREQGYMTWGWRWLESLLQDVRFGLRQLWKTPGFTITAVLTLALGIGANAAIFTLVNAVLMKNLPVADPKNLIRLGNIADCCINGSTNPDGNYSLFSTDNWQQLRKGTPEFEELAAMQAGFDHWTLIGRTAKEAPHPIYGEFVSGNYFRMFGLSSASGRLINDDDDVDGAPIVGVMSYNTWKNTYNRSTAVIGSTFYFNTHPVTIVGVAPESFFGDRLSSTPPEFYFPIAYMDFLQGAGISKNPQTRWLDIIGRVKPGTSIPALQQKVSIELRQIFSTSKAFSGLQNADLLQRTHVVLTPGGAGTQAMQSEYASNLKLLMSISGLVLLVACANIANLLLVRGMARKAEMSVRTALGAARSRIIRQLLTESMLLAGVSGISALIVSYAGAHMLLALAFPGEQNVPIHANPSAEVLLFSLAISTLTGTLFGAAPAFIAANAPPADVLRSGGRRTAAGGASLLQRSLVILQAALSVILLVGAALFGQSLGKLQHTNMKLDATNRYIIHFNAVAAGYRGDALLPVYRTIIDQFHTIPGVLKVGLSTYTPMEDADDGDDVQVQGRTTIAQASNIIASQEYFDSVGTRLLEGRGFTAQDTSTSPRVVVVNEDFVKAFFRPGEDPIGHRMGIPGDTTDGNYQIVGVVTGTSYTDVRRNGHHPMFFIPLSQGGQADYVSSIVIQTTHPMNDMEELSRRIMTNINPNLAMQKFETFDAQIAGRFTHERMLAMLMTLFGGLALLLATVGLYGVTSYTVVRRTSEIGIRMALGAERSGVVAMVMRSALLQTLLGLMIGVPVAFYGVTLVKSQLYELKTVSGVALAIAVGTLLMAASVASLIPARRAASVDPARALRTE